MASLQIDNIPESLLRGLREAAKRSGRTMNEQIVESLKGALEIVQRDRAWIEDRLAAAAALRESMAGVWITDDEIRAARDEDRV